MKYERLLAILLIGFGSILSIWVSVPLGKVISAHHEHQLIALTPPRLMKKSVAGPRSLSRARSCSGLDLGSKGPRAVG